LHAVQRSAERRCADRRTLSMSLQSRAACQAGQRQNEIGPRQGLGQPPRPWWRTRTPVITTLQVLGSVKRTCTRGPSSCCRIDYHANPIPYTLHHCHAPPAARAGAHVHQEIWAMLSVQLASSLISSLPDRHAAMLQRQDRYCGRARAPAVSPGALSRACSAGPDPLWCVGGLRTGHPLRQPLLLLGMLAQLGPGTQSACGACVAWKASTGSAALRRRQAPAKGTPARPP